MSFKYFVNRERLILRIIMAISLFLWGFQKITQTDTMGDVYVLDFGWLIFLEPGLFLIISGILQLILGAGLIAGIYTRFIAAIYTWMGLMTFIVPGLITIKNPYKFTYGLVMAACGVSLLLTGAGTPSWDSTQLRKKRLQGVEE